MRSFPNFLLLDFLILNKPGVCSQAIKKTKLNLEKKWLDIQHGLSLIFNKVK